MTLWLRRRHVARHVLGNYFLLSGFVYLEFRSCDVIILSHAILRRVLSVWVDIAHAYRVINA